MPRPTKIPSSPNHPRIRAQPRCIGADQTSRLYSAVRVADHLHMKANKLKASKPSTPTAAREQLRTRTGIKAGDLYMHVPRGSNDGNKGS